METGYKLKLLNGPLQGRQLLLPPGTFTIGENESDLLLTLEGGGNATLNVDDEGVSLANDTPCWINGVRLQGSKLPLLTPIDLAGVYFILSVAGEDAGSPNVPRRKTAWQLPLTVLVVTLLMAFLFSWGLLPEKKAPAQTPQAWLEQALRAEPALVARWQGDKMLFISGRCTDSKRLNTITSHLQALGVHLQQEAICNDDLTRSIVTLMASYGYQDVTVKLNQQGRAEIDAPLSGNTASLAKDLNSLAGLTGWHLSDIGAEELQALVVQLRNLGLLTGLNINRANRSWLLSGQLTNAQQARLKIVLDQLNSEAGRALTLQFIGSTGAVVATDYLPAPMASIGGNLQAPFLQLTNGMRLQAGAQLDNGMKVVDLSIAGVSLLGSNRLVFIPFNS